MKTLIRIAVTGLSLTLLSPTALAAQIDTSTDQGQVAQVLREVRLANAADDIDGVLQHYWNDPRLTVIDPDDGFKITGWAEYQQYLQDLRTVSRTLLWRTRHRNLRVSGNNAYATFHVTRHVQFGSTVFKKQERGTYVLRKMDGTWLVVAQHISALPPMLKFQQTNEKQGREAATDSTSAFDIDAYFDAMVDDVSVYDPASPWVYEKDIWRTRVEQMMNIRQFLDLNQFNRTEVEWDDMRIVTVDREIRRPEGSFTERNHGRITWVYLKQPDGEWFLWHDHTSEIPEDFSYQR